MKLLSVIKTLALVVLFSFAQGIYAAEDTHTNAHPNDAAIVTNIKSQIAADKALSDLNVNVNSKNGEVTLSGKANTDGEASKLIEIAQATAGVNEVNTNELTVKESQQPFTDMVITAKVKGIYIREKLFGDKDVSVMSVNVETNNGTVYLTGTVQTQEEAANAVKLAKSIKGVKNVDSKLEVKA